MPKTDCRYSTLRCGVVCAASPDQSRTENHCDDAQRSKSAVRLHEPLQPLQDRFRCHQEWNPGAENEEPKHDARDSDGTHGRFTVSCRPSAKSRIGARIAEEVVVEMVTQTSLTVTEAATEPSGPAARRFRW